MKTITAGGVPEYFNLPVQLAAEAGAFAASDIDFTWKEIPQGTGAMVQQLQSGELDLAILLTEGAVKAICNGLPARIIGTYVASPLVWGVHVPAASGIKDFGQVWEQPFAISRYGSGSHLMAIHMALQHGVTPESLRFEVVDHLQGAREAFGSGRASVFMWEKYTTKPLVDAGEFRRVGEHPTPWPCFVLVASDRLLQQPDTAAEVSRIILEYTRKTRQSPDLPKQVASRFGLQVSDATELLQAVQWAEKPELPAAAVPQILQVFRTAGVIGAEAVEVPFFSEGQG